jgi:hypothetical protein
MTWLAADSGVLEGASFRAPPQSDALHETDAMADADRYR